MNSPIIIQVWKSTDGPFAVSAADGQRVHDQIAPLLRAGKPVTVSFAGIDTIIAAFLSTALGHLYGEFSEAVISELLTVCDLNTDDRMQLDRVVRNAKMYYANPAAFDAA